MNSQGKKFISKGQERSCKAKNQSRKAMGLLARPWDINNLARPKSISQGQKSISLGQELSRKAKNRSRKAKNRSRKAKNDPVKPKIDLSRPKTIAQGSKLIS
jgi:hypothetical protein